MTNNDTIIPNVSEKAQRLFALLSFKGMPCKTSVRELGYILGVRKNDIATLVKELDGVIGVTMAQGRGLTTYYEIGKEKEVKDEPKKKKRECHVERKQYGTCVWLTDKEYDSLKKKTIDDWGTELAINILCAFKEKRNISDTTGDFVQMLKWVVGVVEVKRAKRATESVKQQLVQSQDLFRQIESKKADKVRDEAQKNKITYEKYIEAKNAFLANGGTEEAWLELQMANNK